MFMNENKIKETDYWHPRRFFPISLQTLRKIKEKLLTA